MSILIQEEKDVAQAAMKKLQSHGWYMTQELVPLSLFNEKLSYEERSEIAKALSDAPVTELRLGKPKFPLVTEKTSLSDLIGPQSHFIFKRVGVEPIMKYRSGHESRHSSMSERSFRA